MDHACIKHIIHPKYLTSYHTKLYEYKIPEKPLNSNCAPRMDAPHPELTSSAGRVKRNNKGEMCHNNNIRKHTWTNMQTPAQEIIIKTRSGKISKTPERYGNHQGLL